MNMEEMIVELQRFVDSMNIQMDVREVLNNMSTGDFVEISQAMDNSDNTTIMDVLQKYRARMSESYNKFTDLYILESDNTTLHTIVNLNMNDLFETYKKVVKGSTGNLDRLSLQDIRTLVYEDLSSTLNAQNSVQANNNSSLQSMNPTAALKTKQTQFQQNAGNPSFKVSTPSETGSDAEIAQLIGVDQGTSPDKSLVVTKQNDNKVKVFNINDVQSVTEEDEHEEVQDHEPELSTHQEPEQSDDDLMSDIIFRCFSRK